MVQLCDLLKCIVGSVPWQPVRRNVCVVFSQLSYFVLNVMAQFLAVGNGLCPKNFSISAQVLANSHNFTFKNS